ncbi:hypothetical protein A2U01_0097357, partial [Trifolium medium]|nr:hypothetical protein [Trifolium medium]
THFSEPISVGNLIVFKEELASQKNEQMALVKTVNVKAEDQKKIKESQGILENKMDSVDANLKALLALVQLNPNLNS